MITELILRIHKAGRMATIAVAAVSLMPALALTSPVVAQQAGIVTPLPATALVPPPVAGGMIAYRVVRMAQAADGGAVFSVRGDASWAFDQTVEAQQVLGRVVSVERGSRQVELTSQRAKFLQCAVAGLFRLKRWLHSQVAIPRNERVS